MKIAIIAVTAAVLGTPLPALAQDADAGLGTFNRVCRQCHVVKDGDNRIGPYLKGVVGRKAGEAKGYENYSDSLKASGIVWDDASLDKWIENPDKVMSGHNMINYPGIADQADRANLIAYLKTTK